MQLPSNHIFWFHVFYNLWSYTFSWLSRDLFSCWHFYISFDGYYTARVIKIHLLESIETDKGAENLSVFKYSLGKWKCKIVYDFLICQLPFINNNFIDAVKSIPPLTYCLWFITISYIYKNCWMFKSSWYHLLFMRVFLYGSMFSRMDVFNFYQSILRKFSYINKYTYIYIYI